MSGESAIEWTNSTWNPVTGCDRVSPGCLGAHCYALDLAARLKGMGQARYQRDGDPKTSGPGFGVTLHPDKLEEPLRWTKPRMVFVNSMSDLFHEAVPERYIAGVFAVMAHADRHCFQVLTKRPERMQSLLTSERFWYLVRATAVTGIPGGHRFGVPHARLANPLSNVWLGVSIENRRFVHRADLLRETPAAVRFISAEPLLGPLVRDGFHDDDVSGGYSYWSDGYRGPQLDLSEIDWLIAGGESGPGHRPIKTEWVRALRDEALGECLCCARCPVGECQQIASGNRDPSRTAFFVKQGSGPRPGKQGNLPDDLWAYKEFPQGVTG